MKRRTQRHDHRAAQRLWRQLRALQHRAVHATHSPRLGSKPRASTDVGDAELPQRRDRVRREAEPEAELSRRRRPFEDANIPPGLPQGDAGGQAADAGADDQGGPHHRSDGLPGEDSVGQACGLCMGPSTILSSSEGERAYGLGPILT